MGNVKTEEAPNCCRKGEAKSSKQVGRVPFRDVAQEQTLFRWRREKAEVHLAAVNGDRYQGVIIDVGLYSVRMQTEFEDMLMFKTGIVSTRDLKRRLARNPKPRQT